MHFPCWQLPGSMTDDVSRLLLLFLWDSGPPVTVVVIVILILYLGLLGRPVRLVPIRHPPCRRRRTLTYTLIHYRFDCLKSHSPVSSARTMSGVISRRDPTLVNGSVENGYRHSCHRPPVTSTPQIFGMTCVCVRQGPSRIEVSLKPQSDAVQDWNVDRCGRRTGGGAVRWLMIVLMPMPIAKRPASRGQTCRM